MAKKKQPTAQETAKKKIAKKPSSKKVAKKTVKKAAPKAATKKAVKKASEKIATKAKVKVVAVPVDSKGQHPWVGKALPSMTLENQNGEQVNLPSLAASGSQAVLYFYPKDDTPGCTVEACDFRDNFNRLQSRGLKVYGVSPDDKKSHVKFRLKHGLNFDLLVDEGHKLADALNVWKLKKFMGREYMGVERSTFLIQDGKIVQAWQPVTVTGHVNEVLAKAESLA